MGILKSAMEEALEEGVYSGVWICPNCDSENVDELEISSFDILSENPINWNVKELIGITCGACGLTYEGIVSNSLLGINIILYDQNETTISVNVSEDWPYDQQYNPDYSHWLDFNAPHDPFTEYMDSYFHIGDIIADYKNHHSIKIVSRMVFVHHITALESFLSNTLINIVLDDCDALNRLLNTDKELLKKKFTLKQIINNENLVTNEVKTYLRGVLYHNLSRVQFLYKTALDIDIFDVDVDRVKLERAIELRHHCVHRNGKDENGNQLVEINREYVESIAELVKSFVEQIHIKLIK